MARIGLENYPTNKFSDQRHSWKGRQIVAFKFHKFAYSFLVG